MKVFRSPSNPIITPKDVKASHPDFEVICVFNAGVTRFNDQIILLLRVAEVPKNANPEIYLAPIYDIKHDRIVLKEFDKNNPDNDFSDPRVIITKNQKYLTSISHLRLAKSSDGINFEIEEKPAIAPENEYEIFGIEDCRITLIDKTYYITYSSPAPLGITTCMASTTDFKNFTRHGVIFTPDNKDVAIFPQKIGNYYYALNRPTSAVFDKHEIWLAQSPDLICWGNHKRILSSSPDDWEGGRLGGGAVPLLIEQGWLEIYHAADPDHRYCLGAVLFDKKNPSKVLAKTTKPIMQPETDYETKGFFGNVVFTCGVLLEDQIIKIYYGAADTSIGYAEIKLSDVIKQLTPVNP